MKSGTVPDPDTLLWRPAKKTQGRWGMHDIYAKAAVCFFLGEGKAFLAPRCAETTGHELCKP